MIRKWIYRLLTAAAVVLLVVTLLHRNRYRSMLFDDGAPAVTEVSAVPDEPERPVVPPAAE